LVVEKINDPILTDDNLTELVRLINEELDTFMSEQRDRLHVFDGESVDDQRRLERLYGAQERCNLSLDGLLSSNPKSETSPS
jgi:hypothetical protein